MKHGYCLVHMAYREVSPVPVSGEIAFFACRWYRDIDMHTHLVVMVCH